MFLSWISILLICQHPLWSASLYYALRIYSFFYMRTPFPLFPFYMFSFVARGIHNILWKWRRGGDHAQSCAKSLHTYHRSMYLFLTLGLERVRPVSHTLIGELFQVPATGVGVSLWGLGYLGANAVQLILLPNKRHRRGAYVRGGEEGSAPSMLSFSLLPWVYCYHFNSDFTLLK